jgi:hypothetical protein
VTQQIINIGSAINDGTGDPARNAFDKSNQNFTELYTLVRPTGNAIEFQFNNTITEPPSTGQIRFNQATQASTTKLWASHTTSSGVNIKQFLAAATTGAKLVLQDKIDNTNYIKFDVTGAPVDKTTYWEFAVAVTASGGNLPNAAILAAVTAAAGGGGAATLVLPQGRLTLQTGVPVMTTTQSAKTSLFYSPYCGNQIVLYDGTNLVPTTFAELSNVTTASSVGNAGPAAVAASSVYDLFVWSNSGTVTLTRGPAWTSDTTRSAGTALVMVNGLWLNNAAITNGPAASRGTYVGTTRSNASSQLNWQLPSSASGGGAGILGVWNTYNRVMSGGVCIDTAANWGYAAASYGARNNNTNNSISFVSGLQEDVASAVNMGSFIAIGGDSGLIAIGVDSTTVPSGQVGQGASTTMQTAVASYSASTLGYHTWYALNGANGTNGATHYGTLASPSRVLDALTLQFLM